MAGPRLNCCEADIQGACDTISHSHTIECLEGAGIPRLLVRAVVAQLVGGSLISLIDGKVGRLVRLFRGLRQGRAESMLCLPCALRSQA